MESIPWGLWAAQRGSGRGDGCILLFCRAGACSRRYPKGKNERKGEARCLSFSRQYGILMDIESILSLVLYQMDWRRFRAAPVFSPA